MSTRCSGTEICSIVFGDEYSLLHNDPGFKYAELVVNTACYTMTQALNTLRTCGQVLRLSPT